MRFCFTDILETRLKYTLLVATFLSLIGSGQQASAADAPACPTEIGAAVAAARTALDNPAQPDKDHAIDCLIEAVAALDAKVEGIRTGTVPLEGFLNARGGLRLKHYGKEDK